MTALSISLLFTAVINFVLALFVLFKNWKTKSNFWFSLFTFFVSFWTVSLFILLTFKNNLAGQIAFISASFLPPCLYLFSIHFPKTEKGSFIVQKIIVFLLAGIFSVSVFLNLIVKENIFEDQNVKVITGILYTPFMAYLGLYVIFVFGRLWKKQRHSSGLERIQLSYVFWGTLSFALLALTTNLLLPSLGINQFNSLGPVFSIIMVGSISYAIIKHRLLDIVVIIRKVTILGILLMIILGIFSSIAFGLPAIFAESLPEESFQITLVAVAFIVALFFQPLRRAIEEFTDKWFFKGAYKPQEVIDALSEKISSVIDLRVLLDSTAQILLGAFRSEHAVFSVREKLGRADGDPHPSPLPEGEGIREDVRFIAYNTEGRHRPMEEYAYDEKHAFTKYFNKYPSDVIIRDELQREVGELGSMKHGSRNMKHESGSMNHGIGKREAVDIHLKQVVLKEMENHDFAIIFPVLSKDELVGIFGLGVKKSGDIYTTQDLNILELYAHQVGVAVENTKLYADLKLFNEKLQLEVEKATQDLRVTNAQLTFRNKDLGALQKITNLITKTLDLGQITQTIADSIQTELGYIGGIIYFYDKEKKALRPSAITKTPLTQAAIRLLPKSPFEYEINDLLRL